MIPPSSPTNAPPPAPGRLAPCSPCLRHPVGLLGIASTEPCAAARSELPDGRQPSCFAYRLASGGGWLEPGRALGAYAPSPWVSPSRPLFFFLNNTPKARSPLLEASRRFLLRSPGCGGPVGDSVFRCRGRASVPPPSPSQPAERGANCGPTLRSIPSPGSLLLPRVQPVPRPELVNHRH